MYRETRGPLSLHKESYSGQASNDQLSHRNIELESKISLPFGSKSLLPLNGLLVSFQFRRTKDRVSYAGDENSRARYFQDHDAITSLLESVACRDKLLNRKRDMRAGERTFSQ